MLSEQELELAYLLGKPCRKHCGNGLYLRVTSPGKATWEVRYSLQGKRHFMTLDGDGYPAVSLADAQLKTAVVKLQMAKGGDPLAERQQQKPSKIVSVNDLFLTWYDDEQLQRTTQNKPYRIFVHEIKPLLGRIPLAEVTQQDIALLIGNIQRSGRPSVANEALRYLKQLFRFACAQKLLPLNPAAGLTPADFDIASQRRERVLSLDELQQLFGALEHSANGIERSYQLAFRLLLTLGIRKKQLLETRWQQLDLQQGWWQINDGEKRLTVPLAPVVMDWLTELKQLNGATGYLFPSRHRSKVAKPLSADTLNRLLKQTAQPLNFNEPFVLDDFRRTTKQLLVDQLGVSMELAQRCLGQKTASGGVVVAAEQDLAQRQQALSDYAALLVNRLGW